MGNSSTSMIADQATRDRALDPTRSLIVQAPAGSGKTTLLVSRFLALLKTAKQPEDVLAITFTRKAAAEMRKRVLEKLPNASDIAHRLRIQTIDALSASLTRQMPVLARFGAQPETVEDASALYLEAAHRTLANFGDAGVARVLAHLDNNVGAAAELLAGMLARRDQWLRNAGNPPTRKELEAVLVSERERLLNHAKALDPRASEEFAKEVLIKSGEWRKKPKPAPADIVGNEPLRLALAALLKLPPPKYEDAQWQALEAILALLIPAVKQLVYLFSIKNQVDFSHIAQGAVQALGSVDDPSDLLLSLDARISHILVDEFQDTSISQWQLVNLLTANWSADDGRTVFLVGDPMQSIYRFREAEVGLFLHARAAGLDSVKLEALTLSTNFRSQAGIVDWVNGFFPAVLPVQADEASGAVPYSPSTTHAPVLAGEAVAWHGFYERGAEAQKVVELVQAAKGSSAILVRNRSHLDAIVPALKAAGVRYRAVEIEQLGEKQVVQDLYALTRALLHPADHIAWLALLRAPWAGFTLQELSRYFEGRPETVWELLQNVHDRVHLLATLRNAMDARLRGGLRERVEGVWLALGGPACVESETGLEDAAIYLDELEALEQAGGLADLKPLEEKLARLWALPDVNAGPGSVEIMTIHKAKGLEWDTVIVPGLDRAPRSGERKLFDFKSLAGNRLLLAPINETGSDKEPLYEYVRGLNREAEDIEAGRLFYVAATRAKQRLHLLACAKADEAGAPKPPNKRSLLAKGWTEAAGCFPAFISNATPGSVKDMPPQTLRRLPAGFSVPLPPAGAAWAPPEEGRDEEPPPFDWAQEAARLAGIVVHGWFQRIAADELRGWDAKRVEGLKPRFARELERLGVAPADLERATGLVANALNNALADERGRWILGPHPMARSEHQVRTPARRLRIDRYIRDASGKSWVIDYKTGEHRGELEKYLDEQQKRYAAQLDLYSQAMGGARRGLYFPLLKGWREW